MEVIKLGGHGVKTMLFIIIKRMVVR